MRRSWPQSGTDRESTGELYDLTAGPQELENLWADADRRAQSQAAPFPRAFWSLISATRAAITAGEPR